MSRHIHKVVFCLLLVSSLFSCGQGNKERSLPQNDQIKKITIFKQPEIMNDTLKPYLFIPTSFISNTNIKNKSYNITVRTGNSQLELLVGDVPVSLNLFWGEITSRDGRKIGPNVPINSCILKSGKYKVVGRIYPRYGQQALEFHSYLIMEGYYREAGNWDYTYPMFIIETPNKYHKNGEIYNPIVGLPYFELQTEIEVEVPYEVEGWSHSVNLKEQNEEELKKEMQQRYDDIRQLIAKKDTAAFRQIIKEREDLLGTVYYYSEEEKENRIKDLLTVIMSEEFDIAPYPQEAQLLYFAEGKMVTLVDPVNREGVICLVNRKDPKDIVSLEFRFHRKKPGQKLSVI